MPSQKKKKTPIESPKLKRKSAQYTKSWSSSCRAASTDIPDPLSPLLPIIHRPRQVFRDTSRILT